MCQLYIVVALPKITYGIDIWYYPPNKQEGHTRNSGSVMFLCNLQKIQCIAVLTITGTLRSSPNDYIDIHANIFLLELALSKACHNAIICYLTLPETNPMLYIQFSLSPLPSFIPSLWSRSRFYHISVYARSCDFFYSCFFFFSVPNPCLQFSHFQSPISVHSICSLFLFLFLVSFDT